MIELIFVTMSNFNEVKPIIDNRCAVCHNANNMPAKNWQDEKLVLKYKASIKAKLKDESMPPGNVTNMTADERKKFIEWIDKQ